MSKYKYIFRMAVLILSISLTSCSNWFELHPESEMIQEDFWQDESDVLSAVASCYRGMTEPGFMERVITWGEMRSDNVIAGRNTTVNVGNILNLKLNATNEYCKWSNFYQTINYCNTVLHYAPEVQAKDPNFTLAQLKAYEAEVTGIRALCYFTLVRSFRDVPYITEPTIDDTKSFSVSQAKPDTIINHLITDLEAVQANAVTEWDDVRYNRGRMTQKAIWALLADIYLWKGDYVNCIKYCDKVINEPTNKLLLTDARTYNRNVFFLGNSDESIFELQFYSMTNYVVNEMYGVLNARDTDHPAGQLSSLAFGATTLFGSTDLRGKDAFSPVMSGTLYPIQKYISFRLESNSATVKPTDYVFGTNPKWIFYRLSDAILMKAEALAELNRLPEALEMVSLTYDRANPDLGKNSLSISTYGTQNQMRDLVFDERQREFLFEGKRYYDLLRRIRREGTALNVVNTYLMRKYITLDQTTAKSKLTDLDALYMPIHADELKANSSLHQNPFYKSTSDIVKK